jgi:hypothetical protein
MGFLMQTGQFFGILIAPNMVSLFNGNGLPLLISLCAIMVVFIAITRRIVSDAPEDTQDMQPMGIIGVPQPSIIQAEGLMEELRTEDATNS